VIEFSMVVLNVFSKIIAVLFLLTYKHVYKWTFMEQKVPDNSEVQRSLRIFGPWYGSCFMLPFWHLECEGGS
jgi:hypothetical protein